MSKKKEFVSNQQMAEEQIRLIGEIVKNEMTFKDFLDKDTRKTLDALATIGELYVNQCKQQDAILAKLDKVLEMNESLLRRTQLIIGQNHNLSKELGEA